MTFESLEYTSAARQQNNIKWVGFTSSYQNYLWKLLHNLLIPCIVRKNLRPYLLLIIHVHYYIQFIIKTCFYLSWSKYHTENNCPSPWYQFVLEYNEYYQEHFLGKSLQLHNLSSEVCGEFKYIEKRSVTPHATSSWNINTIRLGEPSGQHCYQHCTI